ncbi:MAG: MarR family winged helix-turn-helix transcriptional regulator [Acidimicrobiales bacterium]
MSTPTTPPHSSAEPLARGVGFRLSRISRTLRSQWASELADLELSPPEAAVLRGLAEYPGSALRELARILASDPMSAKRCVDGLERRGLVVSGHRGNDRRPRTLTVSAEGLALVGELNKRMRLRERRLARLLSADERDAFERVLCNFEHELDIDQPRSAKEIL